jgi:hypothetical protein
MLDSEDAPAEGSCVAGLAGRYALSKKTREKGDPQCFGKHLVRPHLWL